MSSTAPPVTTASIFDLTSPDLNESTLLNGPTVKYNQALLDNLSNKILNETHEGPVINVDPISEPLEQYKANVKYDSTIQINTVSVMILFS